MKTISIPEGLPFGVSKPVYDFANNLPKVERKPQPPFDNPLFIPMPQGLQIMLEPIYPLTTEDGIVIHGCMIGANGSRVWLIDDSGKK